MAFSDNSEFTEPARDLNELMLEYANELEMAIILDDPLDTPEWRARTEAIETRIKELPQ